MKIRKTISLDFDGFYPEGVTLPDYSGLYFVYKGTPAEKGECYINELLYIGQAENIRDRVSTNHEHYEDWKQKLSRGEKLYYSVCSVEKRNLDMAEAACIYKAQPPGNNHCKESYNYDPVRIISSGPVEYLPSNFDVE